MPTVPSPDPGSMSSMGEYDEFAQSQKPTATQVLLAAGTMHNQGRLVTGDSHIGFGGGQIKFPTRSPTRTPHGHGRK
jgi:hypothetical protein